MLLIRYLIIVGLSSDNPQAMTRTSSGKSIGRSISGLKMPLLPIVYKFVRFSGLYIYQNCHSSDVQSRGIQALG